MKIQLAKICSMGLDTSMLGRVVDPELQSYFSKINQKFGFNECGEGGEYETVVFDSPLFRTHRLVDKAH